MATVYRFLPKYQDFIDELQARWDYGEAKRHERFMAVVILQRMTRGFLIRKHVAWLSYNALIIQCAFRRHLARKAYRAALWRALKLKHAKFYARNATIIQALWRGYWSRKTKFDYYAYRRWLRRVTEQGERRAAEAQEFAIRTRADDLKILEEEARQWLAYVVFKLHHLLRTYSVAGIYSDKATHEYSEFEKLIKSVKYTDYMRKLKKKYDEFVKKHKPKFSNKRLFPIIGEGADYWYLSLPEMLELTTPRILDNSMSLREKSTHHGNIHKVPFLWRKVRTPTHMEGRGPFTPRNFKAKLVPAPPAPSPSHGDLDSNAPQKDPRFYLYVKYYKPQPELMDYIDFHVNTLLTRKCSIKNLEVDNEKHTEPCRPKIFPSCLM